MQNSATRPRATASRAKRRQNHHLRANSLNWQNVANLRDNSFDALIRKNLLIVLPRLFRRLFSGLAIRAVIDERTNRNSRRELRHSAGMIHVIVREQNEIDFRDPGFRCRCNNAIRVASRKSRPSGIDQQRVLPPASRKAWPARLRRRQNKLPAACWQAPPGIIRSIQMPRSREAHRLPSDCGHVSSAPHKNVL